MVSRLCNYFPERFIAYAFIAVPHNPPWPTLTMETLLAGTKAQFGYELYGYWLFFSEDGAEKILEDNVSGLSDLSLLSFQSKYIFSSGTRSSA